MEQIGGRKLLKKSPVKSPLKKMNSPIREVNYKKFLKNKPVREKTSNKRISAIIPVHMWGNAVDLKPLIEVCKDMNIIIEQSI